MVFLTEGIINAWSKIKIVLYGAPITHDILSFFSYESRFYKIHTLTLLFGVSRKKLAYIAHIRDTVLYNSWEFQNYDRIMKSARRLEQFGLMEGKESLFRENEAKKQEVWAQRRTNP